MITKKRDKERLCKTKFVKTCCGPSNILPNRYDEEEFAKTPANNENMILLLLKKIHVNIKIDK
jgi:hypothetical protein